MLRLNFDRIAGIRSPWYGDRVVTATAKTADLPCQHQMTVARFVEGDEGETVAVVDDILITLMVLEGRQTPHGLSVKDVVVFLDHWQP